MRIQFELTVDAPRLGRPRRARAIVAAICVAVALAVPAVALASHVFSDVPDGHTFHTNIANLAGSGITAGCGPTTYCPDEPVTRGQMAAFLNRGLGRAAEADVTQAVTGVNATEIGNLTITPGTSSGAPPTASQFVYAQFHGTVQFTTFSKCPCRLSVRLLKDGVGVHQFFTVLTVSKVNVAYPISSGGVIVVTGSSAATVSLQSDITVGGDGSTAYTVFGTIVALTVPFGSTGAQALGGAGGPAVNDPMLESAAD